MPSGVYRPMTWADLLNSINGQNSASVDTATSGLGYVAEADEQTAWADAATGIVFTGYPGWDQEVWGATAWQ
jgi:hypothetical protein